LLGMALGVALGAAPLGLRRILRRA
jgi:hypothetical protein